MHRGIYDVPVSRLVNLAEATEQRTLQLAEHVQPQSGKAPRFLLHLFERLLLCQGLYVHEGCQNVRKRKFSMTSKLWLKPTYLLPLLSLVKERLQILRHVVKYCFQSLQLNEVFSTQEGPLFHDGVRERHLSQNELARQWVR